LNRDSDRTAASEILAMAPRSTEQRRRDTLEKFRTEEDCWVASANGSGRTHLIPLSFYWDGARLIVATPNGSRTARNLRRAGVARMALGPTRDVVIVSGPLEFISDDAVDPALGEAHAQKTGFDPRTSDGAYVYICLTPERILAWRTAAELEGARSCATGAGSPDFVRTSRRLGPGRPEFEQRRRGRRNSS
jgi:hypothetical protein